MSGSKKGVGIVTDKLGRMNCPHCNGVISVAAFKLFEEIRCPECFEKVKVPGKFGNFILIGELGKGGMGAVYLAEDESLKRRVALKVMRQEFGADEKFYESLAREAQAAAQLNHANVAQVYSFGQENGQPYIVMELVNGSRLDALMKQGDAVEEETVLRTAIDVAMGLDAAAKAGLVHGDIKPANILYDKTGRAKIVDFGLAARMGSTEKSKEVWGTPFYIAPEKARKKAEDHRSDQYSFGASIWHALIGRPPFDGKTPTDVVLARMGKEPPLLTDADASISPATSEMVRRMMDLNPSQRYPTYASLIGDLKAALESLTAWQHQLREQERVAAVAASRKKGGKKAPRKGGSRSSSAPVEEKAPNKGLAILGMLAVIGISVASVWFFFLRDTSEKKGANQGGAGGQVSVTVVRTPENPFLPNEIKMMKVAEEAFQAKQEFRAETEFNRVRNSVGRAKHQNGLVWLEVMQATRMYLTNQGTLADANLRKIRQVKVSGPVAPGRLVELLTGEVTYTQFESAWGTSPRWYLDYAAYCAAVSAAVEGKTAAAEKWAAVYAERTTGKPEWAYFAQPNAQALKEEARRLKVVMLSGKPQESELNAFIANAMPVWMPGLAQYLPKQMTAEEAMREAEKRKAQAEAARKEAARSQTVSAADARRSDLDLLKNLNNQIGGLIKAKDFSGAKSAVGGVAGKIRTDAGKQELAVIQEKVNLLDGFKTFLVTGVKSLPYRGAKLSGDRAPTGADARGLVVTAGGRSGVKVPWNSVSDADFINLGSFYLNAARLSNPARAKLGLGLAVYVYDKGDKANARKVVAMSEKWDRTIRTAANKVMPYL